MNLLAIIKDNSLLVATPTKAKGGKTFTLINGQYQPLTYSQGITFSRLYNRYIKPVMQRVGTMSPLLQPKY